MVVVAPNDTLIEKLKSNLQEVRARGGELFVFADADSHINSAAKACTSSACLSTTACSRPSSTWCRCNCWRITPPRRGDGRGQTAQSG